MIPFLTSALATAVEPQLPPSAEELPVGAAPVAALSAPRVDAANALAFGDHLLGAGDAFNALTWYRLALFLGPSGENLDPLRFRVALAYERGERFEAASFSYGQVSGDLAARAAYRSAICEFKGGNHEVGALTMQGVATYHPGTEWGEMAPYAEAVLWLEEQDLARAQQAFGVVPAGPWSERAAGLAQASSERVPHRSPALAAGLSVLPGLGQVYAGHYGDGAMAFAANATLGLAATTLLMDGVRDDRTLEVAAGLVLGAGFGVTWSSNLVGAWRGAERANQHRARNEADGLLETAWDPALELDAEDISPP